MSIRNPLRDVSWHGVTHCKETGLPKLSFIERDASISYFRLDADSAHKMIGAAVDCWLRVRLRDESPPMSAEDIWNSCEPAKEAAKGRIIAARAEISRLELMQRLGQPYRADIFSQPEKSSGNPSSDVSTPEDGENVCPPTTSSSAAASE